MLLSWLSDESSMPFPSSLPSCCGSMALRFCAKRFSGAKLPSCVETPDAGVSVGTGVPSGDGVPEGVGVSEGIGEPEGDGEPEGRGVKEGKGVKEGLGSSSRKSSDNGLGEGSSARFVSSEICSRSLPASERIRSTACWAPSTELSNWPICPVSLSEVPEAWEFSTVSRP